MQINIIVAVVLMIFGVLLAFNGYKYFKIYIFVSAFLYGLNFFNQYLLGLSDLFRIVLSVGFSIVAALLSLVFYPFALFLGFTLIFLTIFSGLTSNANLPVPSYVLYGLILLISLILSFFSIKIKLDKIVVTFISSLVGAVICIVGFLLIFNKSFVFPNFVSNSTLANGDGNLIYAIIFGGLVLILSLIKNLRKSGTDYFMKK